MDLYVRTDAQTSHIIINAYICMHMHIIAMYIIIQYGLYMCFGPLYCPRISYVLFLSTQDTAVLTNLEACSSTGAPYRTRRDNGSLSLRTAAPDHVTSPGYSRCPMAASPRSWVVTTRPGRSDHVLSAEVSPGWPHRML